MKLSRKSLQVSEQKIKSAEAFVNDAEPQISTDEQNEQRRGRGKPRKSKELTKPVSISLSEDDKKTLDDQFKRFNMLAYKYDLDEKTLNRSDIVRIIAQKLKEMDDDKFMDFMSD